MNVLKSVILIFSVGLLCGCHAAQGLKMDIKESTATLGEKLQQTDSWMQEHMW